MSEGIDLSDVKRRMDGAVNAFKSDIASLRVFMATLRKKIGTGAGGQPLIQTHIGVGYRMLRVSDESKPD